MLDGGEVCGAEANERASLLGGMPSSELTRAAATMAATVLLV